eukprot:1185263-Prorocentrum_minimum.AAC.2
MLSLIGQQHEQRRRGQGTPPTGAVTLPPTKSAVAMHVDGTGYIVDGKGYIVDGKGYIVDDMRARTNKRRDTIRYTEWYTIYKRTANKRRPHPYHKPNHSQQHIPFYCISTSHTHLHDGGDEHGDAEAVDGAHGVEREADAVAEVVGHQSGGGVDIVLRRPTGLTREQAPRDYTHSSNRGAIERDRPDYHTPIDVRLARQSYIAILLHFTGPPVPITARVLSTPQSIA